MKIAVLFDGAGLARLGLEMAGHECTGVELNPVAHHLGKYVGSGNCVLADVRDVDISGYDAVWASPPCQWYSAARTQGDPVSEFAMDLLEWSLALPHPILWVENVLPQGKVPEWGKPYNAAQFEKYSRQNRNRLIGGRYKEPQVFHPWKKWFPGVCPTITATEYKGCATDERRASRFYGRKLTVWEAAYHQGFSLPVEWSIIPEWYEPDVRQTNRESRWLRELYTTIGNGVPVYMAKAFGESYPVTKSKRKTAQRKPPPNGRGREDH